MIKKLYDEYDVQAIADAIRAKTGKTDTMTIGEMAGEVEEIDLNRALEAVLHDTVKNLVYNGTAVIMYKRFIRSKIESVDCPNYEGDPTIDMNIFSAGSLKKINFPKLLTISYQMFWGCPIERAVFPAVTSVHNGAMYNCKQLTYLEIKKKATIWYTSFGATTSLKTVVLRSTQGLSTIQTTSFANNGLASGTGYIYVPSALIEDYKVATNWATYASQFRALEDYTVDGTIDGELDESKI